MKEDARKLFEVDGNGKTTHLRGIELPKGMIRSIAVGESEKVPTVESSSVVRRAYEFARRIQTARVKNDDES